MMNNILPAWTDRSKNRIFRSLEVEMPPDFSRQMILEAIFYKAFSILLPVTPVNKMLFI